VEEVITECRKRGASRVDVLAFEFEMGLFPAVLDEAKQKGIDLAPKTIPPEVFDKRAVEKGSGALPRRRLHRSHAALRPEEQLTPRRRADGFLGLLLAGRRWTRIAAELKAGKSEVVCEAGKLMKISKDKQGIVTRDVLTKKWTDWVDYWAVDFDYESRKEIIKVSAAPAWAWRASCPDMVQGPRRRVPRLRGTLDRRLHLRERMAELPHPPETATSN
jgi:adenine-specific DNA-methyltransferase